MDMKIKIILCLLAIAAIRPAIAVDCGAGGCKVCETTTCSGVISPFNGNNGSQWYQGVPFVCTNGYKVECNNSNGVRCDCYKDNVLQYSAYCSGEGMITCVINFTRMCTGM
jgi:hypothetical protein